MPEGTVNPFKIEELVVHWKIDEDNNLLKIFLDITGQKIRPDDIGRISSSYPVIEAKAFNAACFLSNSIYTQTSIYAFDPHQILQKSPELIAETEEEKEELRKRPITAFASLGGRCRILGKFDPDIYQNYYNHNIALAHYSLGCQQKEPSIKFEQYYKVIEEIFSKRQNEPAEVFDKRVSDHISKFDSQVTQDLMKNLRQIRNRCIHPTAHLGHLSPDDIIAVHQINSFLGVMHKIARLSLDNPAS